MLPSEAIEAHIRGRVEKLGSFYNKIISCRVLVEAPHHHHRAGQRYHVRIDLTVPGREIVIKRAPRLITAKPLHNQKEVNGTELEESREPSKYAVHDDILLAARDAFDAARRKLQDFARRERGVVKVHEGSRHARIIKLSPDEGFGFLGTNDGREIYFNENSVLESGFSGLQVGTEVHFVEEAGEKGPQASTVTPVKHHDATG